MESLTTFSFIFLGALAAAFLLEAWLDRRQTKHVLDNRAKVPKDFAGQIDLEAHQKAADYTIAKLKVGRLHAAWGVILLIVWTLGGGLELLDQLWRSIGLPITVLGTVVILSLGMLASLLDLPFSIYSTFVLEERFGFNKSTPRIFVMDLIKSTALSLLIAGPLVWLVLWLMVSSGTLWWLWAWAVWFGFGLVMIWAYPTFIAPIFNKFEPLSDPELKQRIETLMQRCGFTSGGLFVMDGSKRSSHGNAYFTGLGKQKRIVFFDTLLERLEPEEVEAVLAHELGHFKRHHIRKRLMTSAALSLAGLALLGWLAQQTWFYQSLGLSTPSAHGALILFALVLPLFTIYFQPISAYRQRKHEFEADDYAADQSSADHLISALVKLYRDNASTLTPDPLYSAMHDSHPPAPVRVAHLRSLSER